ncbi:MAG TPA: glycosyltransferase family 2 protein [Gemmatimonadales bacterium]
MSARPFLSVIVPAYNATATIRAALEALAASELTRDRFELTLVDDGSTDETSLIGAEYCDRVVRLSGKPHGPAFARNRGAEVSRGEVLVFVDADVVVHKDALGRLVDRFNAEPDTSAVFGSYDDKPSSPGLVSQYRNLLHHYVHQRGRGQAQTFWAGLGAIRRDDFVEVGMFDEWHYARPQIEDIELGRRLSIAGHHIVLDPDIMGTHLKRWTLGATLLADFQHRGVPWMWLLIQEGQPANAGSLNVRSIEKVLTGLTALGLLTPVVALVFHDARWLLATLPVALMIGLVNAGFYRFLIRIRGLLFAMAVFPLHLAYYAGNAISVVSGWLVHHLFGEPIPPAEAAAHAQIGIATWPPPPRRSTQSIWERRSDR